MTNRGRAAPWLAVLGSVLSFALLIDTAGLIPTVIATVCVASRGSRDTTFREALVLGAGLALGMSILFAGILGQPLHLVGSW